MATKLDCNQKSLWSHGSSLVNFIKSVSFYIQFSNVHSYLSWEGIWAGGSSCGIFLYFKWSDKRSKLFKNPTGAENNTEFKKSNEKLITCMRINIQDDFGFWALSSTAEECLTRNLMNTYDFIKDFSLIISNIFPRNVMAISKFICDAFLKLSVDTSIKKIKTNVFFAYFRRILISCLKNQVSWHLVKAETEAFINLLLQLELHMGL